MNLFPGTWSGDRLLDESTGIPVRLAVPPPPEAYFPIDFTNLFLGIDDSDEHVARVVCLDGGATRFPQPICCRRFKHSAKLLAYVKGWVRASGSLHVALRKPNQVSGPPVYFLEQFEDIPVDRLGPAETLPYEEEWHTCYQVEQDYNEAFSLALTLAYRVSAASVLDDVRQLASEAEGRLKAVQRCLSRLSWATKVPF